MIRLAESREGNRMKWLKCLLAAGVATLAAVDQAAAAEYYIAPDGSDAGSGAINSPWGTFDYAISQINSGDTLYARGGTYDLASRIRIQKGGVSGSPINLWAYPGETPVLDFASNASSSDRGIQLERDWWNLKGLIIQNAPDNGVWVSGSNNVFDQLVLRWNGDSGLQLSGSGSRRPSNNLIVNTDSYENYDPQNHGENADGFAAKFRELGPGNVFRGNRAWGNSDDGWDFWAGANGVTVEDSWAFENGYNLWNDPAFAGDGNGLKLGKDSGPHVLTNVLVWGHPSNGVDVNGNATELLYPSDPISHGVTVSNVTSYDNGGRNFRFDEDYAHVLRNNISFDGSETIYSPVDDAFNTWNGIPVDAADFLSLDDTIARGPRQPDGSLPLSSFLRLAPGSSLIDAGTDVGLPYIGSNPDLGAFESALPGDFNGDGEVDAADFTVWRDHLGADESAINFAGDGMNGVDQADYYVWRDGFGAGQSSSNASLTAAPEPQTLLLVAAAMAAATIAACRLRRLSLLAALAVSLTTAVSSAQMPFFPGAEGYGGAFSGSAPSAGWFSNATVYHVTNLNDDGAGSLREAFDQNSSNKIIVFDVAGTVELTSDDLNIKNLANYYIAGQTAPGPVTIYGDTTQLTHSGGKENRNVVLRYLSFRKGDDSGSDSVTFAGGGLGTNIILDHVSASWSEDEILSVANNNTNVTVQYSTIHDALDDSHAYGSLIRPRISSEVSFHHNLYANNASRQARFGTYNGETLTADFRNNVIYNFRDRASYTGGSSESDQEKTDVNFVGNYIIAGPGTEGRPDIVYSVDKNVDTRVYQAGNYIDPDDAPGGTPADGQLDGWDIGWAAFHINNQTDQTLTQMATPFNTPAVTTQTAPDAYNQVRDYVGNWWWARDEIDARVVGNLVDFTGVPIGADAPIASELSYVTGNTTPTTHPAGYDTDGDAMPDVWEIAHGLNPSLASDWNLDFDNDGYINLIEFINEKGEFPAPAPIVFNGSASQRYADIMNWKTDDGVTSGTNWQPSGLDDAVVHAGAVTVDAVGQHAGTLLIAPDAADNAALTIAGGWLMVAEKIEVGSSSGQGALTLTPAGILAAPLTEVHAMGQVTGDGELTGDLVNAGTVAPGSSVGVLMVDGDYSQTLDGSLAIELASGSSYDQLLVSGMLTAAGVLDVTLLGGYAPELDASFEILTAAGGLSGQFATTPEDLPALGAALQWDIVYGADSVQLTVVGATLDGDYNGNGVVDAADYTLWRDGDSPDSSIAGYQVWRDNFGASQAPAAKGPTTVPAPHALMLAAFGVASALGSGRRRIEFASEGS